ncbi:MAG: agmatinase [Candidatus Bathycorpusculaceae bacterium]
MSLFFGAETKSREDANAYMLGLCWDKNVSFRKGTAKAPKFIREYTSSKIYNPYAENNVNIRDWWKIYDLGDLTPTLLLSAFHTVKEAVGKNANSKLHLFLGGDHSITYATFKALKESLKGSWGLIYFDAHPDLYNIYEGNPYSHACTVRRIIDEAIVSSENVVQIGIRASTAEQTNYTKNKNIKIVSTSEIYKNPKKTSSVINEALDKVDNVYVSFDVDVLDPAFAPGVSNPEGGGITLRNLIDIIQNLKELNVKALDIVEANPDYDCMGITFCSISKFIREFLGITAAKLAQK